MFRSGSTTTLLDKEKGECSSDGFYQGFAVARTCHFRDVCPASDNLSDYLTEYLLSVAGKDKDGLEKHYTVDRVIGSGGFGTVYGGVRRKDNFPVSIIMNL